jgi:mono/diheme cytochrome c family protein
MPDASTNPELDPSRDGSPAREAGARTLGRFARAALASTVVLVTVVTLGNVTHTVFAAEHDASQAERGAAVYAFSCSTCHGRSGRGFEEAVSHFPEDHQYCARCHGEANPPQMNPSQIMLSQLAFSLGDPPPLAERDRIARFRTAGALFHYVRASMPRWDPGRLEDDAYLDVTSHLLRMVGILGAADTLAFDELDTFELE